MVVKVNPFDKKSIRSAITELHSFERKIEKLKSQLPRRLATYGATVASFGFSRAFTDNTPPSITVERTATGCKLIAAGEDVCFIEFGAGATYGYGHPRAKEFRMGPGTWNPSSDKWKNPKGWYKPGGEHSMGNPPAMAMYAAKNDMVAIVGQLVKEILES